MFAGAAVKNHQVVLLMLLTSLGAGCAGSPGSANVERTSARHPSVRITFVPESDAFAGAAREYQQIWDDEGERIVAAMESVSGLSFVQPAYADTAITAIVLEEASSSGYRDSPVRMRASYSAATKRATLIHELGHRLMSGMFRREEEQHFPLFLWLYDTWTDLYGSEFADEQVLIERRRRGPYPDAWDRAQALSPAERAAAWRAILAERTVSRR